MRALQGHWEARSCRFHCRIERSRLRLDPCLCSGACPTSRPDLDLSGRPRPPVPMLRDKKNGNVMERFKCTKCQARRFPYTAREQWLRPAARSEASFAIFACSVAKRCLLPFPATGIRVGALPLRPGGRGLTPEQTGER